MSTVPLLQQVNENILLKGHSAAHKVLHLHSMSVKVTTNIINLFFLGSYTGVLILFWKLQYCTCGNLRIVLPSLFVRGGQIETLRLYTSKVLQRLVLSINSLQD